MSYAIIDGNGNMHRLDVKEFLLLSTAVMYLRRDFDATIVNNLLDGNMVEANKLASYALTLMSLDKIFVDANIPASDLNEANAWVNKLG